MFCMATVVFGRPCCRKRSSTTVGGTITITQLGVDVGGSFHLPPCLAGDTTINAGAPPVPGPQGPPGPPGPPGTSAAIVTAKLFTVVDLPAMTLGRDFSLFAQAQLLDSSAIVS